MTSLSSDLGAGEANAAFPLRSIAVIAVLAMAIAFCLPFDHGIAVLTGGSRWLHMLVVGAMALAGGGLARRAGLHCGDAWLKGLVWALVVAAYVLLLDFGLARAMLAPAVVAMAHQPLSVRLVVFMARAFNEGVIYRLFWFSALVAGMGWLRQGRDLRVPAILAAGFAAQIINIGCNVMLVEWHDASPMMMAYWLARYVAPGVLYAWLYWREGFVAVEVASVACHLILQPVFGLLL